jgi:hypothetical protein
MYNYLEDRIMKNRTISIHFDAETYKVAEKLAKLAKKSIPEMIKEMIKTKGRVSYPGISKSVKKISGILKTDKDYKELREMIIDEKIERYESLS